MSQQDNFGSGFFLGTLFGGVVGGIVGAVVASRVSNHPSETNTFQARGTSDHEVGTFEASEEEMELARRGLEDKIAQLNSAIDDVRHRLGATTHPQSHDEMN